jgi:ubiquinone/menaquinone biosynthesis C-methylase UbiE
MIIPISPAAVRRARRAIAAAARRSHGPSETPAKWRAVWANKGTRHDLDGMTLLDLLALDGFDTGGGKMNEAMWFKLNQRIRRDLEIRQGHSLLEVGCGAGAFLLPFTLKGIAVSGVDYSPTTIEIARMVLPGAELHHAEANRLPFSADRFDRIVSMGVFHYFPSWDYTERVLEEMLRVLRPGGRCMVMDINDLAKRKEAERKRSRLIGAKLYRKMYRGLGHKYFNRQWFVRFAQRHGLEYELSDQDITHYGNSDWRFNFCFRKPALPAWRAA